MNSRHALSICPKHNRQLSDDGICADCGCKPDIKAIEQRIKLQKITDHIFQICNLLEETGRVMQSGTLDNGWSYKFKQQKPKANKQKVNTVERSES